MATKGHLEEGLEGDAGEGEAGHEACDDRQLLRPSAKRGRSTGPSPTDGAKDGTKRHVIADRNGLPLAAMVTGANAHDSAAALRLVDAIPSIRHGVGRPRRRPLKLNGDKAYDSEPLRRELRKRGIKPLLNRRRKPRKYRKLWPVERTQAWINQYGRLKVGTRGCSARTRRS